MRIIAVLFMSGIISTATAQESASIQKVNLGPINFLNNGKILNVTSELTPTEDSVKTDTIKTGRKTDTTEIKVGKTRIVVIGEPQIEKIYLEKDSIGDINDDDANDKKPKGNKKVETDWFNIDLGINTLLDNGSTSLSAANKSLELNGFKSVNFTLYIFDTEFDLIHDYVKFTAGIGLDYNNYRFSKNISLQEGRDSLTITFDSVGGQPIKYEKNKLLAKYVVMPLMLEFNTKPNKKDNTFHLAGGVELGYLINGRTKQVYDDKKEKVNDDFNLRDFRYGFVGRVGYGDFSFYAKYYPESVFADNEGPDLNTLAFGISLGF